MITTAPMKTYMTAILPQFGASLPPPPALELAETASEAVARFCRPGPRISILALHRRASRAERQHCSEVGMDMEEVALGIEVAVLAAPNGWAGIDMTVTGLFKALTRDMPKGDSFAP
ncbi:MAG: hypothetical protein K2X44_12595, partial [Magnetospirillum sp.]|nr:hypothetical protein [Magnetospirillum sp.]